MQLMAAFCLLLAAGCVSAQTAADPDNSTTSTQGTSTLDAAQWPLPSSDLRLIQTLRYRVVGPDVVSQRLDLERGARFAFGEIIYATGAVRWENYTTAPAVTPGFEAFSSVVYEVDVYFLKSLDVEAFAVPPGILYANYKLVSQLVMANASISAHIMPEEQHFLVSPAQRATEDVITVADSTRLSVVSLSSIQLSGEGLLPFTTDKQTAFGYAVFTALGNLTSLFTVNVSDYTVGSSTRQNRKLAQSAVPSVTVNVWTESSDAHFLPSSFWHKVMSSRALESAGPLKLTAKFLNATTSLLSYNRTMVATVLDPVPAAASTSGSGSSGLSAGAIAGTVIGCVTVAALAAILAAVLFVQRSRSQAKRLDAETAAAAVVNDSFGSSSFSSGMSSVDMKPGKGQVVIGYRYQSVDALWAAAASRHRAPSVELRQLAGGGRAPQLVAADIEMCIAPDGHRVVLGGGAFSTVYKGRHRLRDVAIKVLQLEPGLATAVQREVQLAERVSRDANVVQFYGAAPAPDGREMLLVMELMKGGDLRAALDSASKGAQFLWRNRGAGIAADIARGLAYIHSAGVVHRDLKSSNVLLTADGVAKVADVGAAALMDAEYVSTHFGTLAWAAPELLMADNTTRLDAKADSFSLGVVLWEIVTGETPVRGSMRPVRAPEECPPEVAALVAECLAADPAARPSAAHVGERLAALAARA